MKNRLLILVILVIVPLLGFSQKFKSNKSSAHFFSNAPVEDIEATNMDAQSIFDTDRGEIVFSIPIDKFEFDKSLMKEHFNENYMETEKYPTASFRAKVKGWEKGQTGKVSVSAEGELSIHGVSKTRAIEGTIEVLNETLIVDAAFWVELEDHKVKIPKAVFYNIAEKVKVTVHFEYQPLN